MSETKCTSYDYILNHVKQNLHEVFDDYYQLTFGFYDLDKVDRKIKDLSRKVKNEVYEKGGKFYELFEEIGKVSDEIYNFEYKIKKDVEGFDIDEGMSTRMNSLHQDAMEKIAELMFIYGAAYGKSLESHLSNI